MYCANTEERRPTTKLIEVTGKVECVQEACLVDNILVTFGDRVKQFIGSVK